MSVKLSNANLHRDGDSGGNSNDLRTHIGKRRAATAASTVNAATAATTGLARPQPDPAVTAWSASS